jgi:hypothetical protein
MVIPANYKYVSITKKQVIIQDVGPWTEHATITNDAENVVREVHECIGLGDCRLFYIDSEGNMDEIKVCEGEFLGFLPT